MIRELFTNEDGRIILIGNFTMRHIGPYSISRPCMTSLGCSEMARKGTSLE